MFFKLLKMNGKLMHLRDERGRTGKQLNSKMYKKIIIIGIILLLGAVFTRGYIRKSTLGLNGVESVCKVVEIKKVGRGARTLDSKAVYFSYQVDGNEYIDSDTYYSGVTVGDCYKIIYLPTNPKIVKVNFKKPLDCSQY